MANKESLTLFAQAVSKWNRENPRVCLDIFTPDLESPDSKRIRNLNNVRMSLPVKHEEVPALLADSDLLLLPLDFSKMGLSYAQYSIPTKASEYMMSGTPILAFAPSETAIVKFCNSHNCAFSLTKADVNEIYRAIDFIIENEEMRESLTRNSSEIASILFEATVVREKFQTLLSGLIYK